MISVLQGTDKSILLYFCECFLEEVWGNFFAKKVPPQNLKDYNIAQTLQGEG